MSIPGVKNEYSVAKLNLYAFALTPGSGKTFNSNKHPSIIDIDSAVHYTPELFKLMEEKKWKKLMKIKTNILKKYIKDNYADKIMSTNNLILLVHAPEEAEYMGATLLGAYKIPYNKLPEISKESKHERAEHAWNNTKNSEIKTHREIETLILEAATKYL